MSAIAIGDVVHVKLPWSEVCMYMRVADKTMGVLIKPDGAQILNPDGSNFSSPITHGEAGLLRNPDGSFYTLA